MKINYNWLKNYIDGDLDLRNLENILTFAGIEVESITYSGKELEKVIIVEITERKKHPNADKLSVCNVFDGTDYFQVVCGAPNCNSNQKAAFAPVGAVIGDFLVKEINLRGIESSGMLCSEKELHLSDDHSGILILSNNAPVGMSLADYLNKSDICYELEITPNRPDLLGIIGIARDVAAATKNKLQLPLFQLQESELNISDFLSLTNQNPQKCTRYTARVIRNVTVKESPEWLKHQLLTIGLRPINNIVDITNFVMMEYGHPIHAFDYDKISGKQIIVRDAKAKELFPALDERNYQLDESDLVIADAEKPIALAGIIGGLNSHITESTRNIVIEAANFTYSTIRKSSGKYKIFTDSSYRFERNIADETAEIVSQRVAYLILTLAGGELCKGMLNSYPQPLHKDIVKLRMERLRKLTNVPFTTNEVVGYLSSLGLESVSVNDEILSFSIPFYRKDITREIDVIEEIIRLHGYNNVPERKERTIVMNKDSFYQKRLLQDKFVKYGCCEVVNWSFGSILDLDNLKLFPEDERRKYLSIKNPLGSSYAIMRTILLPGLLKNLCYNISHGNDDIQLFEFSKVFVENGTKLGKEEEICSAVFSGNITNPHWSEKTRKIDFFDIKGLLEECLFSLNLRNISFVRSHEPFYQAGINADVLVNGKKMASVGKLDEKVLEKFDIGRTVYYVEIFFSQIFQNHIGAKTEFKDVSKFPTIKRDISFLVESNIPVTDIIDTIRQIEPAIIQKVVLFDEYRGNNVEKGYRSLSISLFLNSYIKTLTDEYVNKLLNSVIEMLQKKYKIELR
jgi:phenylalanyl-tRNA synthetase beta chain